MVESESGGVLADRGSVSLQVARAQLDQASAALEALAKDFPDDPCTGWHSVVELIHHMCSAIRAGEQVGMDRHEILCRLDGALAAHRKSPFIVRIQTWPRGFPGDYETIEYLCAAENRAAEGDIGWFIERYILSAPIAQQHRNKLLAQTDAIRQVILAGGRVLSLACGGCLDLVPLKEDLHTQEGLVLAIDQDPLALEFAASRLDAPRSVRFIRANVLEGLHAAKEFGPFDLVLAGGLFDYLGDNLAVGLLKLVRTDLLQPRTGRALITNIAKPNLYRQWMSYMGDWILIERDRLEMLGLFASSGFDPGATMLRLEATGLTWVAQATAP